MKNLILLTAIFLGAIIGKAQDYDLEDAFVSVYQEDHPKEYRENILKHAQDKWG